MPRIRVSETCLIEASLISSSYLFGYMIIKGLFFYIILLYLQDICDKHLLSEAIQVGNTEDLLMNSDQNSMFIKHIFLSDDVQNMFISSVA